MIKANLFLELKRRMCSVRNIQDDDNNEEAEPQLQTETVGSGGGRKVKTAIGVGDGDDGWYRPRENLDGSAANQPVRHSRLKDIAIDTLAHSTSRDWQDVYNSLLRQFAEFDLAHEGLADILARMVVSAYTVAQYVPEAHVVEELQFTFPYFSDRQLDRIIQLASQNKPMLR